MITMQQEQALAVARTLVKAGVPMFLAPADATSRLGFALPFGWEQTEANPEVLEHWRPGMALCAVTGHTFDLIDIDPRSGGREEDLGGVMPHSYLTAETPSGGRHHFVRTLGVPSLDGKVAPGVDVKSGTLEGEGRGFAFIAPTVRPSKVDGIAREYRWVLGPKGPVLPTPDQLAGDGSGALLRARVLEIRRATASATPRRVGRSQAEREWASAIERLRTNVAHWRLNGWGGEAHSTILAATTALARLDADNAAEAFVWAFRAAGAEPDADDMAKMESALAKAVPDIVVPDNELSFWDGGDRPPALGGSLSANGTDATLLPDASPFRAGSASGRRRFQPMSRAEVASIVPPDSLIKGVLLSNTKARVSGPSGTGKTWVVLDMAAHVGAGLPWQGRETTQARALYVAGEGAPSIDARLTAWETKHQRPAEVDVIPEAPQLGTEDWAFFCQEIKEMNYGLIIFDTQGSITVGMEENSNKDANIALARLDIVRQFTGACLLLVHHTGWEDKGRPRGASAFYGGMDTELVLSGDLKDLKLTIDKQKYIEKDKALRLRVENSGPGLVVVPTLGSQGSATGFFDGPRRSEHEVRVQELVAKIDAYYEAGGTSKPTVRALVQVLRKELNVRGASALLQEAAQRYSARLGMPVDLGTDED